MFLAIINDTYSEVKEELSNQKNELQLTDILKQVLSFIHSFIEQHISYILHEIDESLHK